MINLYPKFKKCRHGSSQPKWIQFGLFYIGMISPARVTDFFVSEQNHREKQLQTVVCESFLSVPSFVKHHIQLNDQLGNLKSKQNR